MKTFKCEEMMCDHCVARINAALGDAGICHQVDLATKTVAIDDGDNCVTKALEILDDLGFSAEAV